MATRKSSISANLVIDRRQFKAALDASKGDAVKFAASLAAIKMPRTGALAGGGMRSNFTEINSRATATKNVLEQIYNIASKPAVANVWYGDLADSLTAVMGSAAAAKAHLGQLRLISDDMSLTDEQFEKMVEFSVRLQSIGKSAEFAAEFVREMANAGEGMGRGIEDMEASVMALDAISQRGEAAMKTLIALTKQVPAFRKVIEDGFGVSAAHDLEKLNLTAEELTEGILLGMKAQATAKPSVAEEGLAIEQRKMQTLGADAEDNNGTLAAREALSKMEASALRAKLQAAIAERLAAESATKNAAAKEKKDKADAAAAAKRDAKIAEEEKDEAEKEAAEKKFLADAADQEEVARLRSRGKTKQADKLEKDLAEQARVEQFMTEGNLSESAARAMAKGERRTAEDEEFRGRTGRNRIHGAVSDNKYYGIDDRKVSDRAMGMRDEWTFGKLDAMKADRRNRPLKSQRDREDGKASINPDRFSGMTIKQAEDMLEVLRAIKAATENNSPTTADKTRPR